MSYNEPDRVIRGGGWFNVAANARVAYPGWFAPGFRIGALGLRLIRVKTLLHQLSEISTP